MLFPILFAAAILFSYPVLAVSVDSTVLVIAKDNTSAYSITSGLDGYGIPFTLLLVPNTGVALPELTTGSDGNFGGFVVMSEVSYENSAGQFASALNPDQWTALYNYQITFGVRMVRLDVYPLDEFGVAPSNPGETGCCETGVEQDIFISNSSSFSQAGMFERAAMSTQGLYHYPSVITNASVAVEIAGFGANNLFPRNTTAAIINNFGGREQMLWFTSWASEWSPTSNYFAHAYITWMTRGLYTGFRRTYFSTQVDDMFLSTTLYSPKDVDFRIRTADLDEHVTWSADINKRLPAGSVYFLEAGHNGNGNIEAALENDPQGICQPDSAIDYPEQPDTELEFQKVLGTGVDIWPATAKNYSWSLECTKLDPLNVWFTTPSNRDTWAHVSHTFTHQGLNNATYSDTYREVAFNKAWLAQIGLSTEAKHFSPNGLIPPAITGMHNGDALQAFHDNGLTNAVGDNTRPVLRAPGREHWPLISTKAGNGFDGFQITPRWATTIFYNCDLVACNVDEWVTTSGGKGDIQALLKDAAATNTRHLLSLHHDAFMFHQANLRSSDVEETNVNGVSKRWSLIQMWVEVVAQEMTRLVNWPLISIKHDDLATSFANRMARDLCAPKLKWTLDASNKAITGATVSAANSACTAEIPVTFPGPVVSTNGARSEQIGADPLTVWVPMGVTPCAFELQTPVRF